jgi:plasmid replication initiation protein
MVLKKKKKLLPSNFVVTQSNFLVEARYNLPLAEQRLILTMISRIQPNDEDFKPYQISVRELSEFLGVDKSSAYRECKKTTESLLTRVINIQESSGLLQIGWVSSAKYVDGTGVVNLSFDPLLKPYLLKLKGNFTSSKLEMLLSFKSQYTIRIYNLLKQYEYLKERVIKLELFREIMGLRKDQYVLYADFKRFILCSVQKELLAKADIRFEFEEIKLGRKVAEIKLFIHPNTITKPKIAVDSVKTDEEQVVNPDYNELLSLIPEQHRNKKSVISAITNYQNKGYEYVKRNILYSNEKADKSYCGFFVKALKEDWGIDCEQTGKRETIKPQEIWERNGFASQKEYDSFMYEKIMSEYSKNN